MGLLPTSWAGPGLTSNPTHVVRVYRNYNLFAMSGNSRKACHVPDKSPVTENFSPAVRPIQALSGMLWRHEYPRSD